MPWKSQYISPTGPGLSQTPERPRMGGEASPYFRGTTASPDKVGTTGHAVAKHSRSLVKIVGQSETSSPTAKTRRRRNVETVVDNEDHQPTGSNVQEDGNSGGKVIKLRRTRTIGAPSQTELAQRASSIYASPSMKNLRLVLRDTHCDRSQPMARRLLHVKPRLLQGILFHTPWWLLVAVILLNKTTGRAARPVLFKIMAKWPTMEDLSRACVPELQELLTPLGLAAVRTQRLILFANMYLSDPPSQSNKRPSRVQMVKGEPKYPPTAISHLPGMGRYALDSYRLFCCKLVGEDDWKSVMPLDKELRVYVRWRWAVLGLVWDCERGVIGTATEAYLNDLCEGSLPITCKAPGYMLQPIGA